jgi:uncharacterized protein (DUF305 family)
MKTMKHILAASAVLVALGSAPAMAQMNHGAVPDTPAAKANMEAHQKMMDAMNGMKPTGDADKDFVMMMIPHHQGAIDMAEVELKYGKDPELKKMAKEIIADQKKEIGEMKKWQSANK